MTDFLAQLTAITAAHPYLTVASACVAILAGQALHSRGKATGFRQGVAQRVRIVIDEGEDE